MFNSTRRTQAGEPTPGILLSVSSIFPHYCRATTYFPEQKYIFNYFKAGGGGSVDEANMKKSIEEIKKLQVSILLNFVVTDAPGKHNQPSHIY